MPENLSIKVTPPEPPVGRPGGLTEREYASRKAVVLRPPTLSSVLALIETMTELDEGVREEVKNIARRYPNQAYPHFIKNLRNIVNAVQASRRESMRAYSVKKDLNECGENRDIPKEGTQKGYNPLPAAPKNAEF